MELFSGNNEYRRFYESIDMIPTSDVESPQKNNGWGGVGVGASHR